MESRSCNASSLSDNVVKFLNVVELGREDRKRRKRAEVGVLVLGHSELNCDLGGPSHLRVPV